MPQPRADIQHTQRPLGQRLGQIGLQHGQTNGPFGPAVDLFRKARRQLVEMAITHLANLRSLSASLLRTTVSMSSPSSLHSSNR
ncbi:MFS transporter [Pseudomonas syringae pv. spinaceae]|uniref:MFS transporter n=1 Tax=Pseudomonas syringae pv. spinaceae TaxID=264459 RepID=A0A0Q0H2D1_PSESX|nr:MFS transporter [Pseudomonas syringae pv. spinaceae]